MPTVQAFTWDPWLGNISLARKNDDFIGERLAPAVPVGTRNGHFLVWGNDHFRTYETRRGDRTRANEIEWTFSQEGYSTTRYSLIGTVSDMEKDEAGNIPNFNMNLEQETVELITDSLALDREKRIADTIRGAGALGGEQTLVGGSQWSDWTNSDPFAQIRNARASIRSLTGKLPNYAIIPFPVMEQLFGHPKITNYMNVSADKVVNEDVLKRLFRVDNILVPSSVYDSVTSYNVAGTGVLSDIWGKDVILCYLNPLPGLKTMTLAATFRYTAGPGVVKRWREEDREIDVFEVNYDEDNRVVAPGCGYIIRNAVS